MVIDGKAIALQVLDELKRRVGELEKNNLHPHLAVILVGDDASSEAYVRQKELKAKQIGAELTLFRYSSEITEEELLKKIEDLNNDPSIHGIIIQRPLPVHIDGEKITLATSPQKDIDGFHPKSPFTPPIALAVEEILKKTYKYQKVNITFLEWLSRQDIIILGKGQTAGRPIISYFQKQHLHPIIIDSKTENKETLLQQADIIISAIGQPHSIPPSWIKKGAILIGVGMNKGEDGKMYPDYDETLIKDSVSFYTPVPGGVGPVNVAMLLSNLLIASKI